MQAARFERQAIALMAGGWISGWHSRPVEQNRNIKQVSLFIARDALESASATQIVNASDANTDIGGEFGIVATQFSKIVCKSMAEMMAVVDRRSAQPPSRQTLSPCTLTSCAAGLQNLSKPTCAPHAKTLSHGWATKGDGGACDGKPRRAGECWQCQSRGAAWR